MLYRIFVKRDQTLLKEEKKAPAAEGANKSGGVENSEFYREDDPDIKAARDKYVQEQTRELLYSMKATEIPKGVKFSFFMMSFPLLITTGYLGALAPMVSAGAGVVDPAQFAYLARTCMRILALNISFMVSIYKH